MDSETLEKMALGDAVNAARIQSLEDELKRLEGKNTMADTTDNVKIHNHAPATDPTMAMLPALMAGTKSGDGGLLGSGGGLLGGLLLGSILRNGNLLGGGDGAAAAVSQPTANMSIMATLGDLKQAVAVGTAQMETSQALQSSTIQGQLSQVAAATVAQIGSLKDQSNQNTVALMQMINQTNTNITNDGEKTRALITNQYEMNLQRQLADANAAIIELRNGQNIASAARATEVNVNTNVNQQQQQQQQQVLLDRVNQVLASHQYIQQGIVNLGTMSGGSGTQTAANTRVY